MEKAAEEGLDCKDWFMCFKKLPKEEVEAGITKQ
jgi:hypothetical protein